MLRGVYPEPFHFFQGRSHVEGERAQHDISVLPGEVPKCQVMQKDRCCAYFFAQRVNNWSSNSMARSISSRVIVNEGASVKTFL